MIRQLAAAGFVCAIMMASAGADTVNISASKDNTLYESSLGNLSNGIGEHMFVGRTSMNEIRRGLIDFDIAASVPAGATINSVSLTLSMSRTIVGEVTIGLYPALNSWGEGASDARNEEGRGTAAKTGDATWLYRFYNTDSWAVDGGDFASTPSATTVVGDPGLFYTWESTPQLIADVQNWLDQPDQNFGWVLVGDESTNPTTKRFDTKDNLDPAVRPVLMVDFTPAGTPCIGDLNGDKTVDLTDLATLLANYGSTTATPEQGDLDGDLDVDLTDLAALLVVYGNVCP